MLLDHTSNLVEYLKTFIFRAFLTRYGEFFNKVPFINTAVYQGFLKLCVLKTVFYVWSNHMCIKTLN